MTDIKALEHAQAFLEKDGGPIHPTSIQFGDGSEMSSNGMSLRDWFSGQVLSGFMSAKAMHFNPDDDAAYCYRVADAMLAARKAGAA